MIKEAINRPIGKKEFVRLLGVLLMLGGESVSQCFLNDEETHAYIVFDSGYTKKVNIECDSHLAIIMDVTKAMM